MENVTELVMVLDGSFRLLAFNNTFAAGTEPLTGRPLSVGDSLEDLLEPEARPTVRALVQRALAGEAFLIDAPITLRGGLHRTYEMSFNPVREAGTVVAAVCIARNVTDRRWEAASRHALLSAIPDAIVVLRRDGVVLDYYPSAEAPLHLERDELVVGEDVNLESTVVTNARHYDALQRADTALADVLTGLDTGVTGDFVAMDIRRALNFLGEITGEIGVEDLLGNIFGKFCIGK